MNIHKFEVSNAMALDDYHLRITLKPYDFSIVLCDGSVWSNIKNVNFYVDTRDFSVPNSDATYYFKKSKEESETKLFVLKKILENTDLYNYLINYINVLSDVKSEELSLLIGNLEKFNKNNLIDSALENNDKELFFKILEEL